MKYYSEITKKLYDSEAALTKAENELKKENEKTNSKIARDIANILADMEKATSANNKVDEDLNKFYENYDINSPARAALHKALKDAPEYSYRSYKKDNAWFDDFFKWLYFN